MSEFDIKLKQKFNIELNNLEESVKGFKAKFNGISQRIEDDIDNGIAVQLKIAIDKNTKVLEEIDKEFKTKMNTLPPKIKDTFTERDKELVKKTEDLIKEVFKAEVKFRKEEWDYLKTALILGGVFLGGAIITTAIIHNYVLKVIA